RRGGCRLAGAPGSGRSTGPAGQGLAGQPRPGRSVRAVGGRGEAHPRHLVPWSCRRGSRVQPGTRGAAQHRPGHASEVDRVHPREDFDLRDPVVRGRPTSHHGPLPRTGPSGSVVAVLLVALLGFESFGTGRSAPPREPAQRGTELAVSFFLLGLCALFGSSGTPPQPRTRTD